MASRLQLRRGTKTEHDTFTGAVGEVTVDTTYDSLRVHDGVTPGGKVASQHIYVEDMSSLANVTQQEGVVYNLRQFWPSTGYGGGSFVWNDNRPKADHDGCLVVDPDKLSELGAVGVFGTYFTAAVSGNGCFERIHSIPLAKPEVCVTWFGAVGDYDGTTGTENSEPLQRSFLSSKCVTLGGAGRFLVSNPIGIDNGTTLYEKEQFIFMSEGASIVLDSTDPVFTSYQSIDDPTSTSNLFTGKILFKQLIVEEHSPSSFMNGDRLYNVTTTNCSFDSIDTVVKSSINKGASYPQGYLQSVYMTENHFSNVRRIIDAKRAFNINFISNFCESCSGGIYVDGLGGPAINSMRINYNVFEGGGLFVRVGDVIGGSIAYNYLESNTGDDVATENAHIVLIAGGSSYKNVLIQGNQFQDTASQQADESFQDVKIEGEVLSNTSVEFDANWTNSRLTNYNAIAINDSNIEINRASEYNFPRNHQSAKVDVVRYKLDKTVSADVVAGELNALTINIPNGNRNDVASIVTIDLYLDGRTAGNVQTAAAFVTLQVLINPVGTGVPASRLPDNHYVEASLLSFVQQENGVIIDKVDSYTGVTMFSTLPSVRVESSGNTHKIWLDSFQSPSVPNYGVITSIKTQAFLSAKQCGDFSYVSSRWLTVQ